MALFGGGGFGFGGNGFQNALTRSDMFEGFNMQEVNSQLRGITSGICDGFYATREGISENRFAAQQCCLNSQAA